MFELDLTRVDYTWQPAGESQPNTFTAQNMFVSPTTTSAGAVFQANGTISAIPASEANVTAMFQGTESVQSYTMFSSSAQQMNVLFRRRQGTYASPTAVQSGNILGAIQWQGYGGSTFGTVAAAEIRGVARQNFTESARGTNIEFYATSNGATSLTLMSTFRSDVAAFTVDVGATGFNLNKTAGQNRTIQFQTSSNNRWVMQANATAETGTGNAGSDFEIRRYSDAGADLGSVVQIFRGTGQIYLQTVTTISSGQCFLTNVAGTTRILAFQTAESNRWQFRTTSTAESSTATGSDFELRRYSNTAVDLGLVMAVTRSTGDITFNGGGGTTTFSANQIRITTTQTPASATATGTAGTICWDANYIYVCTATDTWKRVAIATWP